MQFFLIFKMKYLQGDFLRRQTLYSLFSLGRSDVLNMHAGDVTKGSPDNLFWDTFEDENSNLP